MGRAIKIDKKALNKENLEATRKKEAEYLKNYLIPLTEQELDDLNKEV